jgi:hypothetical protein
MVKPKFPTSYEELTRVILNYYIGALQVVRTVTAGISTFLSAWENLEKTK